MHKVDKNELGIKKNSLILIISFFLLASLILTSDLMLTHHSFYYDKYMHLGYIKAAENLFNFGEPPFSWRILQPLIVNILPFELTISFFILSFGALFFSGIILYKILFQITKNFQSSLIGMVFFLSIVWAIRFNIIEFWYPESLLYFFMLLSVYAVYKQNKILLSIVLMLGVLTKETMIVVFPLYYFINIKGELFKKFNSKLFIDNVIICLPALSAYLALMLLTSKTSIYHYSLNWINEVFLHRLEILIGIKSSLQHNLVDDQSWFLTFLINWYRLAFGAFGGFFLIMFFNLKETKNVLSAYLPLILFSYLQLFIAYDIERLIVISFFPIILGTVKVIGSLVEKGININYFVLYALSLFIVQLFFTKDFYFETFYAIAAQNLISFLFTGYLLFYISKRINKIKTNL